MASPDKIALKEKIGYAMGDTASNMIFGLISSYSLMFFTDVAMLPIGIITTLLLLSRIWDAVNDPVMGMLSDRIECKWGKYRSFFLLLPIPLAAALVLTFFSPGLGTTGKLVYTFVAYNVLMMLYTAINVPYGALITTMTNDPKQRVSFSSIRTLGAALGNLIVSGSALMFVGLFGGGDQKKGFLYTAILFGLVAATLFYVVFFTVKERIQVPPAKKHGMGKDALTIVKSPVWLLFFMMVFMAFGNMFVRISSTTYYFIYVANRPDLIGIFFSIVTLVQIPGAIFANLLSRVMARRHILLLCAGCSVVIHSLCFFATGNMALFFVLQALGGVSITMLIPLMAATIGDIADHFNSKHGIKAAGVVSASMTLSNKLSLSVAGALVGALLAAFGYVPNGAQNPATINMIKSCMSLIPAAFSVLFILAASFFPLKSGMDAAPKSGAEQAVQA